MENDLISFYNFKMTTKKIEEDLKKKTTLKCKTTYKKIENNLNKKWKWTTLSTFQKINLYWLWHNSELT